MISIASFPKDYQFNAETDRRMTRSFLSPHTKVEEFDPRARMGKAAESLLTMPYYGDKIEPTI